MATKLVVDSRLVRPGDTFVATVSEGSEFYRGENDREYKAPYKFNSHPYVNEAIKNGATTIVLSEKDYIDNDSFPEVKFILVSDGIEYLGAAMKDLIDYYEKRVIAVTGSTGKSSACEMVSHSLASYSYKHLSDRPTPISIPLRALNSEQFLHSKYVIIEMPMDGLGQIEKLCKITPPDVSVILNINSSHIVQLGSIENILKAKTEIIENLKPRGVAILNNDDANLQNLIRTIRREKRLVYTFGVAPDSTVQITNFYWGSRGYNYELTHNSISYTIESPYLGTSVGYSIAAAFSVALTFGINPRLSATSLSSIQALPGRMSLLHGKSGEIILDDTRLATPQSTQSLLKAVLEVKDRRKILIQGPILRPYQHGAPEKYVLNEMSRFDKVVVFKSSDWSDSLDQFQIMPTKEELLKWYKNNINADDLVVINGSESVKMWEIVCDLVLPREREMVYNPNVHD